MVTAEKEFCRFEIAGYRVLPVKFSEEFETCRYMYYKQHVVRETHPLKPIDKTLILLNVPPYCNQECLNRLFSTFGNIVNIYFHEKPTSGVDEISNSTFFKKNTITGYKVAYIVFKLAKEAKKAMKMKFTTPFILSTKDQSLCVGTEKWCKEYADSIPDATKLQAEIDEFMKNYDTAVEKEREIEKKKADEPDEDGWTTVSSRGKKRGFTRTQNTIEKINRKESKKRAQRELLNFYTFQIRDTKREHIDQLRKKFEDDKKKVALLKASRKFKPY